MSQGIAAGGIANNAYWLFAVASPLNSQICVRGFRAVPALEMTFSARPAINASYRSRPAVAVSSYQTKQAVTASFDAFPAVKATIRVKDCSR